MPGWYLYFTIAQTVVTAVSVVLLALLRLGSKGGQLLRVPTDLTAALADYRAMTEKRLDKASGEMSRLASVVQPLPMLLEELTKMVEEDHERQRHLREHVNVLPLRLQADFVTRREAEERVRESREDRERLQREMEKMQRLIDELRFNRGVVGGGV